jgi:hypothetical protein
VEPTSDIQHIAQMMLKLKDGTASAADIRRLQEIAKTGHSNVPMPLRGTDVFQPGEGGKG